MTLIAVVVAMLVAEVVLVKPTVGWAEDASLTARVMPNTNRLHMRLTGLAVAVLLSACTTVGPDFKRPQVPPGWPTGRVVPSSRWPLTRAFHAADRRRSGGATSTIPCSTTWLPRRSA